MRTLAFDGRMGASGDMILGALIAAGADPSVLDTVEAALPVEYEVGDATRAGISATDVRVTLDQKDAASDHEHGQENNHQGHDHANEDHDHDHETGNHGHNTAAEGHGPHRSYPEVIDIVESMELPESVESDAKAAFKLLGEAEAAVHGTALESTQFHEVGADDAIADVVGTMLLLDDLNLDRIVTTPLATGGGEVEMSHGTYPVPAPAVVEIAEQADWSLRGGPVETELLTPTGAAILAQVAEGVAELPEMTVDESGYGAGNKSFAEYPNVLRAMVGDATAGLSRDPISVLETNLDDASPEELGGLQDTLADAGALDVSILPATMKKSRPGHIVKVVVKPENAKQVARALASETGTLGVREHGRGHRWVADRKKRTVSVETEAGSVDIDVKIARDGSEVFDVSAEFDDAQAAAEETALPVRELMRRAENAAWATLDGSPD